MALVKNETRKQRKIREILPVLHADYAWEIGKILNARTNFYEYFLQIVCIENGKPQEFLINNFSSKTISYSLFNKPTIRNIAKARKLLLSYDDAWELVIDTSYIENEPLLGLYVFNQQENQYTWSSDTENNFAKSSIRKRNKLSYQLPRLIDGYGWKIDKREKYYTRIINNFLHVYDCKYELSILDVKENVVISDVHINGSLNIKNIKEGIEYLKVQKASYIDMNQITYRGKTKNDAIIGYYASISSAEIKNKAITL